jgi:hypothetical protein
MADTTSPFGFPYPEGTDLVRDGAQDIENLAEGVNDYLAAGYLFAGQIRYTSSGTFVKADPFGAGDIGLRAVRVRCVAGGGGGGGAETTGAGQVAAGNGGSGGGYAEKFILASDLTSTVTVTRGSGGAGGAGNAAGTAGNSSSFGATETFEVIAPAGNGANRLGAHTPATLVLAPPAGQPGGAGDIIVQGQAGTPMVLFGSGGSAAIGGSGGSSLIGAGADAIGSSTNGGPGRIYGGGGAGGLNGASQGTARSGGTGANGIVIVDCFI